MNLVERLRDTYENWGLGSKGPAILTEAADAITRLQAENAEMKEAIDSAEIASGVTSDGSLWRFWSQKAIDLATRVSELKRENASLREQVEKAREALEPFAKYAVSDGFGLDSRGNPLPDGESPGWVYVTNGDFRRASRTMEDILREQAKRPVLRPARALKDKEERG